MDRDGDRPSAGGGADPGPSGEEYLAAVPAECASGGRVLGDVVPHVPFLFHGVSLLYTVHADEAAVRRDLCPAFRQAQIKKKETFCATKSRKRKW